MPVFRAPGRVNLIGGQVDYHEGWIVSMAIDHDVRITASPRNDARITATSREFAGTVDIAADGRDDPQRVEPSWGRTVAGVARVLGGASGVALDIASDVPIGAGLSSSAAFEVACALALGTDLRGDDLALAAQEAEHVATGVPCGIQDQMAAVHGRAGHAIFLDCRTRVIEHVPMPPELRVLVVHSGVPRLLEATPYAARRAESLAIAAQLGLPALRDASLEQVRDLPRGRHAVTEMRRVQDFAAALRAGDLEALGPLMLASHASSRDDMGVSIPELDALVESATAAGAVGARLTGAGFGGCVVALVPAAAAERIAAQTAADYQARTERTAQWWIVQAADGAGRVS